MKRNLFRKTMKIWQLGAVLVGLLFISCSGDTDGFDSNGDLFIYGGNIDVTAQSAFDADGASQLLAGSVTINGAEVTELPESFGGPGGRPGNGTRRR